MKLTGAISVTTLQEQVRRDATIVAFNMANEKTIINEDQVPSSAIKLEDMTPEQRRIIEAGQTIAGSFPVGLSKEELSKWIQDRFLPK